VAENHVDFSSSSVTDSAARVPCGVRHRTGQEARRARKAATELRFWHAREQ
jgi:hypothetical protein